MAKHKTTGQQQTRNSERSRPPVSASRQGATCALGLQLIVRAAVVASLTVGPLSYAGNTPDKTEPASNSVERPAPRPVKSGLAPEQQVAALKKEELKVAEALMRKYPDSADAILLMGNVHAGHGDAVKAFEFWKKVLELQPKRADVYKSMGRFAMAKGQYQKAITHWRKALQIDPQMAGVHNGIARALMGLGKQAEAIEELKKDIEVSADSGLGRGQASFSYFLLGQGYLQQKEYEKAKDSYLKAIKLQPNLTNAYYGLFTVCARLKQRDEAEKYMALFKRLKAEDMKVLKDRNEAHDDAIAMRKNAGETFMYAARIYLAKGKMTKAEQLMNKAAGLDPENTMYLMRLASLYQTMNRTADVLQTYKRMSELEPDNPVCYLNIGSASARLKRFDAAEEAFRKAIALAPESSDGYRALATLYLQTGKMVPQARDLAEKAVALEPVAANYFVLSWACDKNGDTASALSAIKRAVELEPNNPRYQRVYEFIRKRK